MLRHFAYTFYRSGRVFLFLSPLGLLYPFYYKKELCKKRKERLKSEFKEGVLILAASLSAGYSIENALSASVTELNMLYGPQGMLAVEFADKIYGQTDWVESDSRAGL